MFADGVPAIPSVTLVFTSVTDSNRRRTLTRLPPRAVGGETRRLFLPIKGLDPHTGNLVAGGIVEQTTRVLENLKAVLAATGKTTVFFKDMKDFATTNEIYARDFATQGVVPPARSTVQVAGFSKDALVEIECIAKESPSE